MSSTQIPPPRQFARMALRCTGAVALAVMVVAVLSLFLTRSLSVEEPETLPVAAVAPFPDSKEKLQALADQMLEDIAPAAGETAQETGEEAR